MSYWASFLLVLVGMGVGLLLESINDIMQWIFAALFGGYSAANVLKWHWWRFNGYGYFWGMIAGLMGSLMMPFILPDVQPLLAFPFLFLFSLASSIVATLMTKPEDDAVLSEFYQQVRPWGFWREIQEKVCRQNPDFKPNTNFGRDSFNILIGTAWQITLVVMPIYIVIQQWWPAFYAFIAMVVTTYILKKNWFDKLERD